MTQNNNGEIIKLRKKGLSYSEIRKLIPVSKSTLSLWLGGVSLSKEQIKRLRSKGEAARLLGSKALKDIRIKKTKAIINKAISDVGKMNNRDLWLVGAVLYWAEGHKQKEHNISQGVWFSNSDPKMISIFLKWVETCLKIPKEDIWFEIYIHATYKKTREELINYWSKITKFPKNRFNRIYIKKNKVHSYRKNRGEDYSGVLRICIKRSTDLNREIAGWIKGIENRIEMI